MKKKKKDDDDILEEIIPDNDEENNKENNDETDEDSGEGNNICNQIILYKNVTKNLFVKTQDISENNKNLLHYEYLLLTKVFINHINIIKYNNYKIIKNQNVTLQLEHIPLSYQDIKKLSLSQDQIKNIGFQLINVIKFIHSKKYLYLELSPSNIRFIIENNNIIVKLIKFDSCIKYVNTDSQFYTNNKVLIKQGNNHYSSRNINLGHRGVRIDDIENILYILLDLNNYKSFSKIKTLKQIKRIIDIKNNILINKTNIDYIDSLIDLINESINYNDLNINLPNRYVNYNKFIKIFI